MNKGKNSNSYRKCRWLRIGLVLLRLPEVILKVILEMAKAIYKIKRKSPSRPPSPCESQRTGVVYPQTISLRWSCEIPKVNCIGFGDWEDDGDLKILVADDKKQLHIVAIEGNVKSSLTLPAKFSYIDCGWHQEYGPRLLGVSQKHRKLYVIDRHGKAIWQYSKWRGIANVHWSDLNGDGNDEIVLVISWPGRLVALTSEGKPFWKTSNIGIWNQVVVPRSSNQQPLVLATEAGGTIKVYEHTGKLLRTLRPDGLYFGALAASVIDYYSDTIQIVAVGRQEETFKILAFDLSGNVTWKTPIYEDLWMKGEFACEDMNGDGVREWVFMENPGELVVVSPQGEKLATLSGQENIEQFIIVPDADGYGTLVTLQAGVINAYQFERTEGGST